MNIRDFADNNGSVIITEKKADVNTIIRGLNRFENRKIADLRVRTVNEAAYELVCAYDALNGKTGKCVYADSNLSVAMIYKMICENRPSFLAESSVCIKTAAEIIRVMNMIRMNYTADAYENASSGKICELKKLISLYEKRLSDEGYLDDAMLIDRALSVLDKISESDDPGKEVSVLLPWTKLKLGIMEISEGFSEYGSGLPARKEFFLNELFKTLGSGFGDLLIAPFSADKSIKYNFFKGFGSFNEVRYIVSKIREEKMDYGDVTVIYAGDVYENILRSEFENADIPYAFASGFHASADPHVGFMIDILRFAKEDFSYEVLRNAVHGQAFTMKGAGRSYSRILREGIGWGYDRYYAFYDRFEEKCKAWKKKEHDDHENESFEKQSEFVKFMKQATDIFKKDTPSDVLEALIKLADDHTYNTENYNKHIREELKNEVKNLRNAGIGEEPVSFLLDYLENLTISVSANPGEVQIMSYSGCKLFDRRNVFAVGLSRENIEKTVTESPVLSDDELHSYAEGYMDDAYGRNRRKKENFIRCLNDSFTENAWIGYSYYDTVEFLKGAPSILYKELMEKAGALESSIEVNGYDILTGAVNMSVDDFKRSWDGMITDSKALENSSEKLSESEKKIIPRISSSTLHTLLGCPLAYHYMIHEHVAKEEQIERNGHSWLGPNTRGNLFHHTIEEYCNDALINRELPDMDEELLKKCFCEQAEEMLNILPAPSDEIYEKEKAESYDIIKQYISALHKRLKESDKGLKVLGCETEFDGVLYHGGSADESSEYDLDFIGSADRVDGYVKDNTLYLEIIDYKTGNENKLIKKLSENKQIQHFVYAAGVVSWAKKNKDVLEKRFDTQINEIRISGVRYEFPYEIKGNVDYVWVSDILESLDPQILSGKLVFPEAVTFPLEIVEGSWQSDKANTISKTEALTICKATSKDRLTLKELDSFCRNNYCKYIDICRLRLRIMSEEVK
ncbi:MAG: PD-(D/E)XK nuclease family protein [Lachnospiraceae bacterium]|nr:PD-(D/E)XK nuclease family protein [Lachnospiraceae bacterium]